MIIRSCTVAEILQAENLGAILEEYAGESSIKGMPAPAAKLEMYRQLEAVGAICVFAAFEGDDLVGFITVLTPPVMPHYSVPLSVCESFFVAREYRKTGAGLRLLHMAEGHARSLGSPGLLVSAPWFGVLSRVLPHVGYAPSNVVYFKAFPDV